jgi:hypothetical protein
MSLPFRFLCSPCWPQVADWFLIGASLRSGRHSNRQLSAHVRADFCTHPLDLAAHAFELLNESSYRPEHALLLG